MHGGKGSSNTSVEEAGCREDLLCTPGIAKEVHLVMSCISLNIVFLLCQSSLTHNVPYAPFPFSKNKIIVDVENPVFATLSLNVHI